jgi:hypothetical protein
VRVRVTDYYHDLSNKNRPLTCASLTFVGRCKIRLETFSIGPVLIQGRFAFQEHD